MDWPVPVQGVPYSFEDYPVKNFTSLSHMRTTISSLLCPGEAARGRMDEQMLL